MQINFRALLVGALLSFSMLVWGTLISAQDAPIDYALAEKYFGEADTICNQDHGRLWGVSLCGPMLLVDSESRAVVANQSDLEGNLVQRGNVFTGKLPKDQIVANNAAKWAGVEWTMITWPLPTDKQDRARLMMHESFHRVQGKLGFPGSNPSNSHLDTRDGRIWLQLEWRALETALVEQGVNRHKAIEDALAFREYRHSLFPRSSTEEGALELNEGLAEYTGVKLSTSSHAEFILSVACGLRQSRRRPSFVRSFAYASGPAYGALLDDLARNWRQTLKAGNDPGSLLQKALALKPQKVSQSEALKRADGYDGATLIATETRRENIRQEQVAKYRSRLVDQPVLILPLTENVQYSFDPNNLVPLDDTGTIYPTLRVSDVWGILEVNGGALVIRKGGRVARVHVSAPDNSDVRPLKGDGWTLQLNEGWKLVAAERKGDYILKKNP